MCLIKNKASPPCFSHNIIPPTPRPTQGRWSMIHRGSCLRDSVKSDGDSASLLSSSATDEDSCASVALDPLEHEWMLCASDGQWDSLQPLLAVEPGLVSKRDFVTGFTCLHWAAKQGKAELLGLLLAFARDTATRRFVLYRERDLVLWFWQPLQANYVKSQVTACHIQPRNNKTTSASTANLSTCPQKLAIYLFVN